MGGQNQELYVGEISGRLTSLEGQVGELRSSVATGFADVHRRLDELFAGEHQRRGALSVIRAALLGGGAIAGLFEAIRAFFSGGGGHHQ